MKPSLAAIALLIYMDPVSGNTRIKINHQILGQFSIQTKNRHLKNLPRPETISEQCFNTTIANMAKEDMFLNSLGEQASVNSLGHLSFLNSTDAVTSYMEQCESDDDLFNGQVVFADVDFPGEACRDVYPKKLIGFPTCISSMCDPSEYKDLLSTIISVRVVVDGNPECTPGGFDTYRITDEIPGSCAVDMNYLVTNEQIYGMAIGDVIKFDDEDPSVIQFNGNQKGLQRFSSLCKSSRGHVVLSDLKTSCSDSPQVSHVPICIADACTNAEAENATNYWFNEHNDCSIDVSIIDGTSWDCKIGEDSSSSNEAKNNKGPIHGEGSDKISDKSKVHEQDSSMPSKVPPVHGKSPDKESKVHEQDKSMPSKMPEQDNSSVSSKVPVNGKSSEKNKVHEQKQDSTMSSKVPVNGKSSEKNKVHEQKQDSTMSSKDYRQDKSKDLHEQVRTNKLQTKRAKKKEAKSKKSKKQKG